MTKGTEHNSANNAGDLLHSAWRNAKFAAQVELRRAKGKDQNGKPNFTDQDVLHEAQKIYVATSANLIASGMADITGDIPRTTIATHTVSAPDITSVPPVSPPAPPEDPAMAARIEQQRQQQEAIKALQKKQELYNGLSHTLNKLFNDDLKLTSTDKDNLKTYFSQAHPDSPNRAAQKATQRRRLNEEDRHQLRELVKQDREMFQQVLGNIASQQFNR